MNGAPVSKEFEKYHGEASARNNYRLLMPSTRSINEDRKVKLSRDHGLITLLIRQKEKRMSDLENMKEESSGFLCLL